MKKAAKFRKEFRCFFSSTDIGEVSDAIPEFLPISVKFQFTEL